MSETTIISEDQNIIQTQIYEGGLTVVNTGSAGNAGSVTLNPPVTISGTNQADVQSSITSLATNMPIERTFQASDLTVAGIFPLVHNLGVPNPRVDVWNNNNVPVVPDDILSQGVNAIGVDLRTFMPIPGVWRIKVGS
jgi:hypothetical protein